MAAAVLLAMLPAARAETPARTYEQWVAMAEAGNPAVDYTALRQAYTHSRGYDGYGASWSTVREAFVTAVNSRDCAKVIELSPQIQQADYTYPLLHVVRANCFHQMGETDNANRERDIFRGLSQSILSSGDGKTTATAYVVVTMAEERYVVAAQELEEHAQALVNAAGRNFDRIDGADTRTGENRTVYFNIDAFFGSLTRPTEP